MKNTLKTPALRLTDQPRPKTGFNLLLLVLALGMFVKESYDLYHVVQLAGSIQGIKEDFPLSELVWFSLACFVGGIYSKGYVASRKEVKAWDNANRVSRES